MKNKTKNVIKIASIILLIVLVQTIGITYGKYISSEKGNGQAEVAKWAFQIEKGGQETKSVNLANTINEDTLVNGKIAPGTSGQIQIEVNGAGSEVDLDYKIEFANEINKPQNLRFTYNGQNYSSLSDIVASGNIKYYEENKTKNITIFWKWAYETGTAQDEIALNDQKDMQDSEAINKYTFDIIATGTQSD